MRNLIFKNNISNIYFFVFSLIYGISYFLMSHNGNFSFIIFILFVEPFILGPILSRKKDTVECERNTPRNIVLISSALIFMAFLNFLVNSTLDNKLLILFAILLVVMFRGGWYLFVIHLSKKN